MGVRAEVDACGVGRRAVEQRHLDCRGDAPDHGDPQEQPEATGIGAAEVEHRQCDERPDQIELLLDGERPRVGERLRCPCRNEVIAADGDLPPIGEVEERREGVHAKVRIGPHRRHESHAQRGGDEHQEETGEEPPGPADPESGQLDAVAALEFREQQSGDQETRQDVEDLDRKEAALSPSDAEVEAQHREHRQRSHAVECPDAVFARLRHWLSVRHGAYGWQTTAAIARTSGSLGPEGRTPLGWPAQSGPRTRSPGTGSGNDPRRPLPLCAGSEASSGCGNLPSGHSHWIILPAPDSSAPMGKGILGAAARRWHRLCVPAPACGKWQLQYSQLLRRWRFVVGRRAPTGAFRQQVGCRRAKRGGDLKRNRRDGCRRAHPKCTNGGGQRQRTLTCVAVRADNR